MSARINKYIDPLSDFGFKHLFGGEAGEKFHNELGFKFLELPKFDKKEDELENELDKRIFQRIFNIAEEGRLSQEQQFLYESYLQKQADEESIMEYAKDRAEEKGLEKGKYETSLAIARKMKEENFDIVKIAGFTALSIEEIESL